MKNIVLTTTVGALTASMAFASAAIAGNTVPAFSDAEKIQNAEDMRTCVQEQAAPYLNNLASNLSSIDDLTPDRILGNLLNMHDDCGNLLFGSTFPETPDAINIETATDEEFETYFRSIEQYAEDAGQWLDKETYDSNMHRFLAETMASAMVTVLEQMSEESEEVTPALPEPMP